MYAYEIKRSLCIGLYNYMYSCYLYLHHIYHNMNCCAETRYICHHRGGKQVHTMFLPLCNFIFTEI